MMFLQHLCSHPGLSTTVTFYLPYWVYNPNVTLEVTADYKNELSECNEQNNESVFQDQGWLSGYKSYWRFLLKKLNQEDQNEIIHISDLHFHRNKKDNKKVAKTLHIIKQNDSSRYLTVIGDIVDYGHETQYKRALEALAPFMGWIFICPGNHNFGALGNLYSRERAERFDEKLPIPLQQGGTFTGARTTQKEHRIWRLPRAVRRWHHHKYCRGPMWRSAGGRWETKERPHLETSTMASTFQPIRLLRLQSLTWPATPIIV